MSTNARLVSKVLTHKKNTFYALRELIDNSIIADAKCVKIDFISSNCDKESIQYHPIDRIVISDNGHGVPFNRFGKSIMELATDTREQGYGVGRFSGLQIGKIMSISTVGYDTHEKVYTTSQVTFNVDDFRGQLGDKEFDVKKTVTDEKLQTGFRVEISSLYSNDGKCSVKNKLTADFKDENFIDSLFEVYHQYIFTDKIKFEFNGQVLNKEMFINGKPKTFTRKYEDLRSNSYNVEFLVYSLKLKSDNQVRIFLDNSNDKLWTPLFAFRYNSLWVSAELGSQYILVSSDFINQELRDKFDLSAGEDEEMHNLSKFLKTEIDTYYKSSNVKFKTFITRLQEEKIYPYSKGNEKSGSFQKELFDSSVFMLDNEQDILAMKPKAKSTIFNLIKKTIEDGNVEFLVNNVLGLNKESRNQMIELIDRVSLDEVIRYANAVSKRESVIKMLYDFINDTEKYSKQWEDGLEKVISQNFWIFGEEYNGLKSPLNDSDLFQELTKSIEENLKYTPKVANKNLITELKPKVKKLLDSYLIRERILGDNQREIIIVFVKSPSTILSAKEVEALQKFLFAIQQGTVFPKRGYKYVVFYIGSQISEYGKSAFNNNADKADPFLIKNIDENDFHLKAFVYEWNELLSANKRKMAFMDDSLKLNMTDTLSTFIQDYEGSYQPISRGRLMVDR